MPQFVFVRHIFSDAKKKSGDTFQYRQSCFGDKNETLFACATEAQVI